MAIQLTIGQLAKKVGVNIQTLRYYERLNLFGPSARRPSGYRLYNHSDEGRLRFIKNAQALGFSLREIAELLTLRVVSNTCRSDVQNRAKTKLEQVESKIADLQRLAKGLNSLIRVCKAGQLTGRCPILTSLEEPSDFGTKKISTRHESF